MAEDELVKYVRDSLKNGFSREEIESALKKDGHAEEEILRAFRESSKIGNKKIGYILAVVLVLCIITIASLIITRLAKDEQNALDYQYYLTRSLVNPNDNEAVELAQERFKEECKGLNCSYKDIAFYYFYILENTGKDISDKEKAEIEKSLNTYAESILATKPNELSGEMLYFTVIAHKLNYNNENIRKALLYLLTEVPGKSISERMLRVEILKYVKGETDWFYIKSEQLFLDLASESEDKIKNLICDDLEVPEKGGEISTEEFGIISDYFRLLEYCGYSSGEEQNALFNHAMSLNVSENSKSRLRELFEGLKIHPLEG